MARGPLRKTRVIEQVEEKYETYTPPSSYDIPEELLNDFDEKGLHLRWVRVLLENQDDYKNVADRRREGYEPVSINELPMHMRDLFETKSFGPAASKYANIAMVGDLALFKITKAKAKARQRYYESVAINNEIAQAKQLGGDSKLNKLLPIINESRTVVRTGNRQNAPQEFGKTLKNASSLDTEDSDEDAE